MSNGLKEDRDVESKESKTGAKYTEAEWQQMVLGLRRENKENIEKLRKEQDEALFKVIFSYFFAVSTLSVFIFFFFCFSILLSDCPEPSFDKNQ